MGKPAAPPPRPRPAAGARAQQQQKSGLLRRALARVEPNAPVTVLLCAAALAARVAEDRRCGAWHGLLARGEHARARREGSRARARRQARAGLVPLKKRAWRTCERTGIRARCASKRTSRPYTERAARLPRRRGRKAVSLSADNLTTGASLSLALPSLPAAAPGCALRGAATGPARRWRGSRRGRSRRGGTTSRARGCGW